MAAAPDTETRRARKDAARLACTRHLSLHPPRSAAEWLALLGDVPDASEPLDVYGEGGALTALEARVADLLGKEAGTFVMKGVIAQLAALRAWTERTRVRRVALHPLSHIDLDEGGAYERLHGLIPARI